MPLLLKTLVSALVIAGVSELGKRSALAGAVLASLPITSILALIWLCRDTGSVEKVSELSTGIFWAVLPSLLFFLLLAFLLRNGTRFAWAMVSACVAMTLAYSGFVWVLRKFEIVS